MKFSFRDKKFRIVIGAVTLVAVIIAGLFLFGVLGKSKKLVEYNGVAFTKGSDEAAFMEEYYTEDSDTTWQSQNDKAKIDREISRRLSAFQKALKKGKWENAEEYIMEENRETYATLFSKDEDKMQLLSEYIDDLEMTYLAEKPGDSSTYYRTAEYNHTDEESGLPVILINVDGEWYIDSL